MELIFFKRNKKKIKLTERRNNNTLWCEQHSNGVYKTSTIDLRSWTDADSENKRENLVWTNIRVSANTKMKENFGIYGKRVGRLTNGWTDKREK